MAAKQSQIIEVVNEKPPAQRTPEEQAILNDFVKQNLWVLRAREERDSKKLDVKKSVFVIDDDHDTKWRFLDGAYYRVRGTGIAKDVKAGRIRGEYLPDPVNLWAHKCAKAGVKMGTQEADKYKPTAAVFALWEHWQGVKNA